MLLSTPKTDIQKIVRRYFPYNQTCRKNTGELEFTTLKETGVAYPLADAEGHL